MYVCLCKNARVRCDHELITVMRPSLPAWPVHISLCPCMYRRVCAGIFSSCYSYAGASGTVCTVCVKMCNNGAGINLQLLCVRLSQRACVHVSLSAHVYARMVRFI